MPNFGIVVDDEDLGGQSYRMRLWLFLILTVQFDARRFPYTATATVTDYYKTFPNNHTASL
jgi:hypothetical protein